MKEKDRSRIKVRSNVKKGLPIKGEVHYSTGEILNIEKDLNNLNPILNVDEQGTQKIYIPSVDSVIVSNIRQRLFELRSSLEEKSTIIEIFERVYHRIGEPLFSQRLQNNAEKINELLMRFQYDYEKKGTQASLTEFGKIITDDNLTQEEALLISAENEYNEWNEEVV